MNPAQTEGLIGMFIVLGILVLLVAPAVIGIVRDRRIDRQIKQAQQRRGTARRVARTV
jgi:F0F1-type ATP synthase membrane subunit b/b'